MIDWLNAADHKDVPDKIEQLEDELDDVISRTRSLEVSGPREDFHTPPAVTSNAGSRTSITFNNYFYMYVRECSRLGSIS